MILTSKLGRFEFDDDVLLSHAKLIRDMVTGQWFSPKPATKPLKTMQDIRDYMHGYSSQLLTMVWFDVFFPDNEPHPSEVAELEELPQPPMIPVPPAVWIRQALVGDARPAWMDA